MYEHYDLAFSKYQTYLRQEQIDRRALVGGDVNASSWDHIDNKYKNQKLKFPLLHAQHQMLVGYQIENRKTLNVTPVQNSDNQTATQLSAAIRFAENYANIQQVESQCFYHASAVGLCFGELYMDKTDDPWCGDIRMSCHPPATIMFDPYWERMDLMDCSFIWSRDYMPKQTIKGILPGREKDIDKIQKPVSRQELRFNYMPENFQVRAKNPDNLNLDRYFYLDSRRATMVHNEMTGVTAEFDGTEEEAEAYFWLYSEEEERNQIKIKRINKNTIKQALMVGTEILYDDQFADYYPFIPYLCYFDPQARIYSDRFQGVVRKGRDANYIYNRRMDIQLDTLESLPTSGINVVEDALVNPMDAFKTGAGQVRVIKKGYVPEQAISQIIPPQIDSSAFKQTDDMIPLTNRLMGINEEMMGAATDSQVGIVEQLRQGAGLITMRTPFDKLESAMEQRGNIMIRMIQEFFTYGKIKRVLGEEPTEEFRDKLFGKYNAAIGEGANTETQKQKEFMQALYLKQMGVQIPDGSIVRLMTMQGKDQVVQEMEEEKKAAMEATQQQQQIEQALIAQKANVQEAQADAYRGLASERESRIQENQMLAVERREKAEKDDQESLLKLVETLQTLQEIDSTRLDRLVNMLEKLNKNEEVSSG